VLTATAKKHNYRKGYPTLKVEHTVANINKITAQLTFTCTYWGVDRQNGVTE